MSKKQNWNGSKDLRRLVDSSPSKKASLLLLGIFVVDMIVGMLALLLGFPFLCLKTDFGILFQQRFFISI